MKAFFSAVFVIIIVNALPMASAIIMGYDRGLIGLESLFIVFLIAINYRFFALIFGLGLAAVELVYAISQIYPLFETNQIIEVAEFIPNANKKYILLLILYFSFSAFVIIFGLKNTASSCSRTYVLSMVIALSGASTFERFNNFSNEFEKIYFFKQTLVGSVYFSLDGTRRFANRVESSENEHTPFSHWPHNNVADEVWGNKKERPEKILFVIVESWGMPKNIDEYNAQILEISKNKNIKIVDEGLIKYGGGTSVAELRELCHIYPHSFAFKEIPEDLSVECLPNKLRTDGYRTIALHGASGHMYHRNKWYPKIGFEESYFFDNPIVKVDQCFSFPGYCDVSLMDSVKRKIIDEKKILFYWLTLNSHIPYDPRDLKNRDDRACEKLNIARRDRCIHFQLISEFFSEFSQKFGDSRLSNLHVIFVGDHSPPFLGVNIREFFSKDEMVPFLYIKIL